MSYPIEDKNPEMHFIPFLEWFRSIQEWKRLMEEEAKKVPRDPHFHRHTVILFQTIMEHDIRSKKTIQEPRAASWVLEKCHINDLEDPADRYLRSR